MTDRSDPRKYVAMPRVVCEIIANAFTEDFSARGGYGGAVVRTEHAIDPFVFHHMFRAILEDGDYDIFDEFMDDDE